MNCSFQSVIEKAIKQGKQLVIDAVSHSIISASLILISIYFIYNFFCMLQLLHHISVFKLRVPLNDPCHVLNEVTFFTGLF